MLCYSVRIPEGDQLPGVTADGRATAVLPGEYLAHVLASKVRSPQRLLRFVGADAMCRDVHVPFEAARRFLTEERVEDARP
jgi:hypothetical protein